jgi:hypothetical protein
MRSLALTTLGVLVTTLAPEARAGVRGDERIELRPPTVVVEQLDPSEPRWTELTARVPEEPFPATLDLGLAEDLSGPLRFALPEQGPDGLDLEIRYYQVLFTCSAELVKGCGSFSPRLDCDSRQTYFWCRLCLNVTDNLRVFCESFQAAGSILGWDAQLAYQHYVWDGFQLEPGVHWTLDDHVSFESGPVIYTFSATRKPTSVGTRFGLTVEY